MYTPPSLSLQKENHIILQAFNPKTYILLILQYTAKIREDHH